MLQAVAKGVGDKLAATAAVRALVGTRIYTASAPANAVLPYIVMLHAAGGSPNRSPRDELDVVLTVRATAAKGATAAAVADAVRAALHDADLTLESPWVAFRCQHVTAFQFEDPDERRPVHYAGGNYRVRAAR